MKNYVLPLLAIGLTLWGTTPEAVEAASSSQPIDAQITLASSTVSLGEPLLLKYQISSSSDDVLSIDMRHDKRGWLSVSLTDALGHSTRPIAEVTPRRIGIHSDGIRLGAHGDNEGYFVVRQGVNPDHIGQYHLTIIAHLTYNVGEGGAGESFTQRYVLPLTVTPRDARKLMTDAQTLQQAALNDTNVAERHTAIDALFSMPETAAGSVWQAIISNPDLSVDGAADIAEHLVLLDSIGAADLLAQMKWNAPPQWADSGFDALEYLQELHRTGSQQIRQHIESLFISRGEKMPNWRTEKNSQG